MVVDFTVRGALEALGRDPPRIMTTAFMHYVWGMDQLEGWVGIDQSCPDNPRMNAFHERFVKRYNADPVVWPAHPVLGCVHGRAQHANRRRSFDHQVFKGDRLHYGRVRGGKLRFEGLFEPVT